MEDPPKKRKNLVEGFLDPIGVARDYSFGTFNAFMGMNFIGDERSLANKFSEWAWKDREAGPVEHPYSFYRGFVTEPLLEIGGTIYLACATDEVTWKNALLAHLAVKAGSRIGTAYRFVRTKINEYKTTKGVT